MKTQMRAARLRAIGEPLRIEQVPVPELEGDAALVKVAGAGVCASDLRIIDGRSQRSRQLPLTMGHEIAGWVSQLGPSAKGLEVGEAVAIMVGWGCGWCRWCVGGLEQLCPNGNEAGSTVDGGFAEYVMVPHRRYLVPLRELNPIEWAPAGDAALSSYAGIKRVREHLGGGATIVVIGAGGLGQFAVQFAHLTAGAFVIAVDIRREALARAAALGADETMVFRPGVADEIRALVGGAGAGAVLDFVGTDDTLSLAAEVVEVRGIVAVLGLGGGSLKYSFQTLPPEAVVTTVNAGSISDLHEVVQLARAGRIRSRIETYALEDVNIALQDLRVGKVMGRAVLTPWSSR